MKSQKFDLLNDSAHFYTKEKKDQKSVSKCLDHLEELPLLPEDEFFAYNKKMSS
jgi:hypothetical protein